MKTSVTIHIRYAAALVLMVGVFLWPLRVSAVPAMQAPLGLSIIEMKMTGNEFIVLQNNTGEDIVNLSEYWLSVYNNVSPLGAGVSNSMQQLPAISLLMGQTIQLSDSPMQTCGASAAGKLSLSFSDSSGFLQVVATSLTSQGSVMQLPTDWVSWSSGEAGEISRIPSNSKNPHAVYYRYDNQGEPDWQQANLRPDDICQLDVLVAGGSMSSSAVTPLTLAATSPPATILGTTDSGGAGAPRMPEANKRLIAPQITEVLPNPSGTGNDSTDEFIEIYNPNNKQFDLSGFILQTGLTTLRGYAFPEGTVLKPRSFTVFYSEETKLSLSNTSSMAVLLDPFTNVISQTAVYEKAKDGLTWSVAKNSWSWTSRPTPGKANIIASPVTKSTPSSKSKVPTKQVAGAANKASSATGSSPDLDDGDEQAAPVHAWVLAVIIVGALLYGVYEYRHDLGNRLYKLRAKLSARRAIRRTAAGRRSD